MRPERSGEASAGLARPLVSIGLPVFNGEAYVGRAIESILSQSFRDLELVICDNASTDRTREICEEFAQRDPRVRYYRNDRNLGAGPNYDLCFHRSRGVYFKWAAHDDMLAPDYIAKAVAALEARPEAVLCAVGITEIGPNDEVLRVYSNEIPGVDSTIASRRFAGVIHSRHQCEDFFSLFRRDALEGSSLHGTYSGSDKVLLAEMALRGPWVRVDEPVFLHREHNNRYTRAVLLVDRRQALLWQDTSVPPAKTSTLFHLVVYRHYWRVVRGNLPPGPTRWGCYWQLLRWWFTDGHLADVIRDVLRVTSPSMLDRARAVKRSLLGADRRVREGDLPRVE